MDTTPLRQFIKACYPLKEEALENLLTGWQPFECKRKAILTAAVAYEQRHFVQIENTLAALKGVTNKYPAIHQAIQQ